MGGDRDGAEAIAAERVRRVLRPEDADGPANVIPVLERLGESGEPAIVIGDVAGALHGWPLEISGGPVEVCVVAEGASSLVAGLGARPDTRGKCLASPRRWRSGALSGHARLRRSPSSAGRRQGARQRNPAGHRRFH